MKIFYTYEEVREVMGAGNVNNDLEVVRPYFETAAAEKIPTITGDDLLEDLATKASTSSHTEGFETEAWKLIRQAVANYGYYLFTYDGSVIVTDQGLARLEDGQTKSAYYNQVRDFRNARILQCYTALHRLALLLHKEQDATWLADRSRLAYEKMLIWKMSDFAQVRKLNTWHSFFAMQWHLDHVLERKIIPLLGQDKYDELVAEVKVADGETDGNARLLKAVRTVLANYAIVEAAQEMNLHITPNGIEVSEVESNTSNDKTTRSITAAEKESLIKQAKKRGAASLQTIHEILNITSTAFDLGNESKGVAFFGL